MNAYFNETNEEEQDSCAIKRHKSKLKACLASFLEQFTRNSAENKKQIAELCATLIDLSLNAKQCTKKIAQTIYYFTQGTVDQRQLIIMEMLEKMSQKLRNQNVTEKWIESLLVFDVNQCDINSDGKPNSVAILKQIQVKLENIMV